MIFGFWLWHGAILLPFLALYFVPTIVALARKPPYLAAAVVVNVFLGWTFIGWIVALVLAAQSPTKAPPPLEPWRTPAQPPPGWPPAPPSPTGWQPPAPASPTGWQPPPQPTGWQPNAQQPGWQPPPQQPAWPPPQQPGWPPQQPPGQTRPSEAPQ